MCKNVTLNLSIRFLHCSFFYSLFYISLELSDTETLNLTHILDAKNQRNKPKECTDMLFDCYDLLTISHSESKCLNDDFV